MDATIGILSYNTKDLLRECLNSIGKFTKNLKYEIIVVENGSKDGSAQMIEREFPEIILIKNKKNRFFARGYNQIIQKARGKYFIMLNSDTRLEDNACKKIIDFMIKNKINACEGLEVRPNGKIIPTGSMFRSVRSDFYELSLLGRILREESYLKKIRMKNFNRAKNFEVDVGCNAFFCISTELLIKIGAYDEDFTLYYTEDDLSKRIKKSGFKIFHCGEAHVVHEDAKSTMQLGWKRIEIFYRDMFLYHKKYNNLIHSWGLYLLLSGELIILKLRKSFLDISTLLQKS